MQTEGSNQAWFWKKKRGWGWWGQERREKTFNFKPSILQNNKTTLVPHGKFYSFILLFYFSWCHSAWLLLNNCRLSTVHSFLPRSDWLGQDKEQIVLKKMKVVSHEDWRKWMEVPGPVGNAFRKHIQTTDPEAIVEDGFARPGLVRDASTYSYFLLSIALAVQSSSISLFSWCYIHIQDETAEQWLG